LGDLCCTFCENLCGGEFSNKYKEKEKRSSALKRAVLVKLKKEKGLRNSGKRDYYESEKKIDRG